MPKLALAVSAVFQEIILLRRIPQFQRRGAGRAAKTPG
jgi:hypothetical protein